MKSRWIILIIVWLLYIINYFDRTSVLTFLPLIREDLNLTHGQIGTAASVFFFAYALAQFSAGWLSDRIGPKKVIGIAIFVFSFITFVTGLVKNFTQFILIRLGLGLGEGHHFAPANKTIANWFPKEEKGRATGFFSTTWAVAPAIIPVTVTWLAASLNGWRPVFYCLAVFGILGIFLLFYFIENTPKEALEKGKISKDEFEYINSGLIQINDEKSSKISTKDSLRILLKDASFWSYSFALFCVLGIYWGSTSWISSFLYEQYEFSIKTMGALASLPYVAAFFAMMTGGWLMDRVFKGRVKPVLAASFICSIPILLLIAKVPQGNNGLLVLMLILLGFFTNLSFGVVYGYPQVRYPKEILGSAVGISNGIGQFGSFIAPLVAGFLVIKNAEGIFYTQVFAFFSVVAIVGLIFTLLLSEKTYNYEEKIGGVQIASSSAIRKV
ncbi:MFS transporter [Desulfallas sp. Bu1-1]|uniref:MFS transporter n=1 Tax=Desulfallas sp. Bu1-1 TaxID=2787620 RepID=UPI00189EA705|nr:MFS transporter [Desulfallas sp. Bu1-1]MBF7082877.1 MFS transporter [Desulfallas sp. Bu1-1]